MFVPRTNRLQHKILAILQSRIGERLRVKTEDIWISASELAALLEISVQELRMIAAPLHREEELDFDNSGEELYYYSHKKTASALVEKKYLKEGRRRTNDSVYDMTKWLVPLTLAFITIYTTVSVSKENKENRQRIGSLQLEVDSLRMRQTLSLPPKVYPDSPDAMRP